MLTPAFLPSMTHLKPSLFVNIAPINPDGVTVVDLGKEMGQNVPQARHSSLPPSPTRAEYDSDHNPRAVRHGSLPPPPKPPKIKHVFPVDNSIEEIDEEMGNSDSSASSGNSVEVTEPAPQNSKTVRVQVNPAKAS